MKYLKSLNLVAHSTLALALIVGFSSPNQAQSPKTQDAKLAADEPMTEQCEALKDAKTKMVADMRAENLELTTQISKMNGASQDKKLDLLAAIVTRAVEQRTAMAPRMEKMESDMLKHLMQHMLRGRDSLVQCPLMKGLKDIDDGAADSHKDHHGEKN